MSEEHVGVGFPPPPSPPPPPAPVTADVVGGAAPRKRKPFWIVGAAVMLVAAAGGVAAVVVRGGGDQMETLRGTFTLFDLGAVQGSWDECSGDGGYDDFGAGQFVTVMNGQGDKIAGTSTRNISMADADILATMNDATEFWTDKGSSGTSIINSLQGLEGSVCLVTFEVKVPKLPIYSVEIGTRGDSTYSYDDLKKDGFSVHLSLGG